MDLVTIGILSFALLFVLIALHIPIGVAMGLSGLIGVALAIDPNAALSLLSTQPSSTFSNRDLIILPLFILMGSFASAAGLSGDLFRLVYAFLGHRPGGLAYATIGACAGFGAVSGSSLATAATMTKVAMPEMVARNYSRRLASGSIAAGGTLGMLIPPSIVMVVYGHLTEQFVLTLFAAALVPGAIAVLFHFAAIRLVVTLDPAAGPAGQRATWRERSRQVLKSWPVVALVVVVMGGIYSGIFTVEESAAVGALFTFLIWILRTDGRFDGLFDILVETGRATAVIFLIIVGASIFTFALTASTVPEALVNWIGGLGIVPILVICAILVMYLILGAVFETISAMVITLPFVFPLVTGLGYDPIWWGIINVMVIEIGLITPPIGMNVFVLHKMAPNLPLRTVFAGTVPFLAADLMRLSLLVAFPGVVLWLPTAIGAMG